MGGSAVFFLKASHWVDAPTSAPHLVFLPFDLTQDEPPHHHHCSPQLGAWISRPLSCPLVWVHQDLLRDLLEQEPLGLGGRAGIGTLVLASHPLNE